MNTIRDINISNIALEGSDGKIHKMSNNKGHYIVIYFYPKDSTPGCTVQGRHYSELLPKFNKLGAIVYGVSKDNASSKTKFCTKQGYKHILLADWPEQKLANLLGVLVEKSMFGKNYMGIERSSFIFDKNANLIVENRKVKFNEDAENVLDQLEKLNKHQ